MLLIGGIEPLLFQREPLFGVLVLLRKLANDQEQGQGDHQRRKPGRADQEAGLLPPVGQRRRDLDGRDDRKRKLVE